MFVLTDRLLCECSGSSTKYPEVMGAAEGTGLYAQFATFNIVYMKYCDGVSTEHSTRFVI